MYQFKIEEISFSGGAKIHPGALTIIVGPNNSGKTQILRDIASFMTGEDKARPSVTSISHSIPKSSNDLLSSYRINSFLHQNGQVYLNTLSMKMNDEHSIHIGNQWKDAIDNNLTSMAEIEDKGARESNERAFRQWLGHRFISYFTTENRLTLVNEKESSEREHIGNMLQAFYNDGAEVETKLREIVKNAFGMDIKLDYFSLRKLLFRVAKDLSNAPKNPQENVNFYKEIPTLDEQGDGLRSFVATVCALLVGMKPVLLLDEPEAFLHPPQAYRLGEVIAEQASDGRQIFVATHSSDFLRGVLSKRQDATIIRVNKSDVNLPFKILDSASMAKFATDPILSSTRILDGLFFQGVIVTEADADAIFYQRIARQLVEADNYHITHAHNKQTVAKVVKPYQSLGVHFAAIVDIDALRVRDEFKSLVSSFGIQNSELEKLLTLQERLSLMIEKATSKELLDATIVKLEDQIKIASNCSNDGASAAHKKLLSAINRIREDSSNWKEYKRKGKAAMTEEEAQCFDDMTKVCASYGLFIVPVGELEGWMVDHGLPYTSNKSKWIVDALTLIPRIKENHNVEPWLFMLSVFKYLRALQMSNTESGEL